jgi:hypothetical protein
MTVADGAGDEREPAERNVRPGQEDHGGHRGVATREQEKRARDGNRNRWRAGSKHTQNRSGTEAAGGASDRPAHRQAGRDCAIGSVRQQHSGDPEFTIRQPDGQTFSDRSARYGGSVRQTMGGARPPGSP